MYFGRKMFMAESWGVDHWCQRWRRRLLRWLSNGIDFDLGTCAINRLHLHVLFSPIVLAARKRLQLTSRSLEVPVTASVLFYFVVLTARIITAYYVAQCTSALLS